MVISTFQINQTVIDIIGINSLGDPEDESEYFEIHDIEHEVMN